jgi:hypothetical protein
MPDQFDELLRYAWAIFEASEAPDTDERLQGILSLRELARTSQAARERLREFIWDDDGTIRFHAAEALSWTRSLPEDAVPVLCAVLSVCNERGRIEADRAWAGVAMGALEHYGADALPAEAEVWPYLYAQSDEALRRVAIRVIANLAPVSSASWTILCLLCRHEDGGVREQARGIMKSDGLADAGSLARP